jgi:hypothetical protein
MISNGEVNVNSKRLKLSLENAGGGMSCMAAFLLNDCIIDERARERKRLKT